MYVFSRVNSRRVIGVKKVFFLLQASCLHLAIAAKSSNFFNYFYNALEKFTTKIKILA